MIKNNPKLFRVLIFTYAIPEELDVEYLEKLNNEYISELTPKVNIFQKFLKIKPESEDKVIFLKTGSGKLNSYVELNNTLKNVYENSLDNVMIKVVNLGTAGSSLGKVGSVVDCGRFIDADIATLYGKNITDLDWCNQVYKYESGGTDIDSLRMYSCNSRDMFVTNMDDSFQHRDGWTAVCDHEAFSQARCCAEWSDLFKNRINFISTKYITHSFDKEAMNDWEKMLPDAKKSLTKVASKHLYNFYYAKN